MAGSHVICEKPFVMRKENINKINKLAKIKRKLIFESFMYVYHPAFKYIEQLIKSKKYGKLRYVISNFRFPSLDKNNNRYNKNEGGGFFYDAAVYLVSLENYLFNKKSKLNFTSYSQKIKNTVDLRGNIYINSKEGNRFYFWGEGQNYSNNLEIFFEKSTVFVDKFFSKKNNERIYIKIFFKNKLKKISIVPTNQVEKMFDEIRCNYNNKSFQNFHRKKITNQIIHHDNRSMSQTNFKNMKLRVDTFVELIKKYKNNIKLNLVENNLIHAELNSILALYSALSRNSKIFTMRLFFRSIKYNYKIIFRLRTLIIFKLMLII